MDDLKAMMTTATDDPASHLALLRLLRHKGIITDSDLEGYYVERKTAMEHIALIGSITALAVMLHEKDVDEDEFVELLEELGISLVDAQPRCYEAMDYMLLPKEYREQLSVIIESLPKPEELGVD